MMTDIVWAVAVALAALVGLLLLLFVGGVCFTKSRLFGQMVLPDTQDTQKGYLAPRYTDTLIGQQGIAQTPLHPVGQVQVKNIRYDAKTQGNYIEKGTPIVVMSIEGTLLTVQAASSQPN
jgi:membrane-bound serine protease (ClpP class)